MCINKTHQTRHAIPYFDTSRNDLVLWQSEPVLLTSQLYHVGVRNLGDAITPVCAGTASEVRHVLSATDFVNHAGALVDGLK